MKKLPNWIAGTLRGAGILHFLLAAGLVFFSDSILATIEEGIVERSGSVLWLQITGIGLAILGLGYLIASINPLRNLVALFMGLAAMLSGLFFLPLHFGLTALTNGLLFAAMCFMVSWAGFLVWILYGISKARQSFTTLSHSYSEPLSKTLSRFRTQRGKNLLQLSNEQPVLVIFLHRFNNASSGELLTDILHKQESIENRGTRLVFVHLASEEKAASFFKKAGLQNEHRISDPNGIMYQAFELEKAVFDQNRNWRSLLKQRISIMKLSQGKGAIRNIPGAFLINRSKIVKSYRYGQTSESPDFLSLASFEAA
jgi:hypothetical protein